MARKGNLQFDIERVKGKNDQFDKIVQETEDFYKRVEDDPIKVSVSDVKKTVADIRTISKEINKIRDNPSSNSGELEYANQLEKIVSKAEGKFQNISLMFKDVNKGTKQYVTGLKGITDAFDADGLGASFLDVGSQFKDLQEQAESLFDTLKSIGQGSYWRGKFNISGGTFSVDELRDKIEVLKQLRDIQENMREFDPQMSDKDFVGGISAKALQTVIRDSEASLAQLEELNLKTTEQLRKRQNLIDQATGIWWNEDLQDWAKQNIKDDEEYERSISTLHDYIEQKENLVKELVRNDDELFAGNTGIGQYVSQISLQIEVYKEHIKELTNLRNEQLGTNIDSFSSSEVVEALGKVKEAINEIRDAFLPLTTALQNEGTAFGSMAKEGAASLDTLLGKLRSLDELITEISKKEFNVSQVFNQNGALLSLTQGAAAEGASTNTEQIVQEIKTLKDAVEAELKTIRTQIESTFDFSTIDVKQNAFDAALENIYQQFKTLETKIKELDFSIVIPSSGTGTTQGQTDALSEILQDAEKFAAINEIIAKSGDNTAEGVYKAIQAILGEGDAAAVAAKLKEKFAEANKLVAKSADATASSANQAAEGIKNEADAAKTAAKTLANFSFNKNNGVGEDEINSFANAIAKNKGFKVKQASATRIGELGHLTGANITFEDPKTSQEIKERYSVRAKEDAEDEYELYRASYTVIEKTAQLEAKAAKEAERRAKEEKDRKKDIATSNAWLIEQEKQLAQAENKYKVEKGAQKSLKGNSLLLDPKGNVLPGFDNTLDGLVETIRQRINDAMDGIITQDTKNIITAALNTLNNEIQVQQQRTYQSTGMRAKSLETSKSVYQHEINALESNAKRLGVGDQMAATITELNTAVKNLNADNFNQFVENFRTAQAEFKAASAEYRNKKSNSDEANKQKELNELYERRQTIIKELLDYTQRFQKAGLSPEEIQQNPAMQFVTSRQHDVEAEIAKYGKLVDQNVLNKQDELLTEGLRSANIKGQIKEIGDAYKEVTDRLKAYYKAQIDLENAKTTVEQEHALKQAIKAEEEYNAAKQAANLTEAQSIELTKKELEYQEELAFVRQKNADVAQSKANDEAEKTQFKKISDLYDKYLNERASFHKMATSPNAGNLVNEINASNELIETLQQRLLDLGVDVIDIEKSTVLTQEQKNKLLAQELEHRERIVKQQAAANDAAQKAQKAEQDKANKQKQKYGKTQYDSETRAYNKIMASVRNLGDDGLSANFAAQVDEYKRLYKDLELLRKEFEDDPTAVNDKALTQQFQNMVVQTEKARKGIQNVLKEADKLSQIPQDMKVADSIFWDQTVYQNAKDQMRAYADEISNGTFKLESFNQTGTQMYGTMRNGAGAVEKVTIALNQANGELVAFKTSSKGVASVWDGLKSDLLGGAKKIAGMYLDFNDFIRYFKEGVNVVKEIDAAMVELRKVTDETETTYRNFMNTAATTAEKIGSTMIDVIKSTADFSRLGYGLEEATQMAESAQVLMNVSEFDNIEDATDTLISAMQAFRYSADESMHVVDVMNIIGNNYAISTSDLAESLTNSSAALVAAGNSLEQTVALTAAGNTILQDPNAVGNALKVVSMRIRGTASELEAAGEETEGIVENTSKLQEKIQALTGVNILKDDGSYKDTYTILYEIGQVYEQLDDLSQASLLEMIAGKTRGSAVAAILQNVELLGDAYETASQAEGSAFRENEVHLESIQGRLNLLTSSLQTMWNNSLKSDALKGLISLANVFVKIADKVGLVELAVGALMARLAFKNDSFGIIGFMNILNEKIQANTQAVHQNAAADNVAAVSSNAAAAADQNQANASQQSADANLKEVNSGQQEIKTDNQNVISSNNAANADKKQAGAAGAVVQGTTRTASAISTLGGVLKVGSTAWKLYNAAMTYGISLLVTEGIQWLMKLIDHLHVSKEEILEAAQAAREAVNSISSDLKDTGRVVDDSAKRFAELAQGVNILNGENLTLTTDEYEEFLDLSNQLAEVFPTLSRNYDENGNAIIQLSGDTDTMVGSLYDLLEVERQIANQKIVDQFPDLFEGLKIELDESQKDVDALEYQKEQAEVALKAVQDTFTDEGSVDLSDLIKFDANTSELVFWTDKLPEDVATQFRNEIEQALAKDNIFSQDVLVPELDANGNVIGERIMLFGDGLKDTDVQAKLEGYFHDIADKYSIELSTLPSKIQKAMHDNKALQNQFSTALITWLSTDASYNELSTEMQSVVRTLVSNIDFNAIEFDDNEDIWPQLEKYVSDNIIGKITGLSDEVQQAFVDLMNISTKDRTTSSYIEAIRSQAEAIATESGLAIEEILQGTGYDKLIEQYETKIADIAKTLATSPEQQRRLKHSVGTLSPEQINKALGLIQTYGIKTFTELKEALEKETYELSIDITTEQEGLESLKTALTESTSAAGMSEESIKNLQKRYKDLKGYNPAELFEETANGIRLNTSAVNELEEAYEKQNKEAFDGKLEELKEKYDDLTDEIANCSNASKRANLYAQRKNVLDQINDTASLASQYMGLTSAYNKWQSAQSGETERSMYEEIVSARKDIKEEIARGWVDQGTKEYLELLSGKDLSTASIDELLAVWNNLDETITGTKFSILDFFTTNADGEVTSKGIYNFLDAIMAVQEKGKEWVTKNEDGTYAFDFSVHGGEAAIAEALGISEELLQIIMRAAQDAGFEVNFESTYTELADLQDEAEATNRKLKEIGATDYTFNITSTDLQDVENQIVEMEEALHNLKNEDGTLKVGVSEQDYQNAQTLLATLIYQKQTLDTSAILRINIDDDSAQTDIEKTVVALQNLKRDYNEFEVTSKIGEDTTKIEQQIKNDLAALQRLINELPEDVSLGINLEQENGESFETYINRVNKEISDISPEVLIEAGIDETLVDEYMSEQKTAEGVVIWDNNIDKVTKWMKKKHRTTGEIVWTNKMGSISTLFSGLLPKGAARVNGTAFANGSWGAPRTETALVGELGPELLVRDGRWTTIGNNGAEFTNIKKGDIIFNHKQTEDLLSKGYVMDRGKAYSGGTAKGAAQAIKKVATAMAGTGVKEKDVEALWNALAAAGDVRVTINDTSGAKGVGSTADSSGLSGSGGKNNGEAYGYGSGSGSDTKDESEELIDFIEIKLEEIEADISKTTAKLELVKDDGSAASMSQKNALYDELVQAEEDKAKTYYEAANLYNKKAADLLKSIPKEYRNMAQNGAIAIEDFVGESEADIAEAIQEYRDMASKADDAEVGYFESIAQQSAYRVEQISDIASDFENIIDLTSTEVDLLQSYIDLLEQSGERLSEAHYAKLTQLTHAQMQMYQQEKQALQAMFREAVENRDIEPMSDDWYEAVSMLNDLDAKIVECQIDIEGFNNSMRDVKWDNLDRLISRFEALSSELSHMYDRFTDDDNVVDEFGNWTNEGLAALGMAAQQMEVAQKQSQQYAKAIDELKVGYQRGEYSTDEYNEKLAELTEKQWDSIEAYEEAKDKIVDLNETRIEHVKDGLKKELDAYKELIDAKKKLLDADKDLYDFEKNVQEQQKDIATIRRKLAALAADDSMSANAQRAKLQAELLEAEAKLQDTYYDRSIEQQKEALDSEYENYEKNMQDEMDSLDKYLTDSEKVVADSLNTIKANTNTILQEITILSQKYGVDITEAITSPWSQGSNAIAGYQSSFTKLTSIFSQQLEGIIEQERRLTEEARLAAQALANSVSGSISSNMYFPVTPAPTPTPEPTPVIPEVEVPKETKEPPALGATVVVKKTATHFSAKSRNLRMDSFVPGGTYTVYERSGQEILIGKNGKYTGWVNLYDLEGYAKGTTGVANNQLAWIDELGEELVLHAGDDGKLAYLTKGSGVIPADLTEKLMNLALDPTQTLEHSKPVISAPNVTNNQISVDMSIAEVVHIDHVDNDTLPDLADVVEKQLNKYMKNLNNQIRKYSR